MTKHPKRFVQAFVLFVVLSFNSCVKDDGLTPRVIEGEWKLVDAAADDLADYEIIWDFEDDGDFSITLDDETYDGEWEWNDDEDELLIEYTDSFGDVYDTVFEVEILDNDQLTGDWILEAEDGYFYGLSDLEFERQ